MVAWGMMDVLFWVFWSAHVLACLALCFFSLYSLVVSRRHRLIRAAQDHVAEHMAAHGRLFYPNRDAP